MSNQIVISSGAKVRNLDGVLTGTSGIVNSVPLGAANGVATLDSGGKVPVSQLPSSVVTYLGTWNAATNTPTLVNGTGDAGDMYICNVAGTVNFGAGPVTFAVGDWVLYGSGTWQKSNGQNGTVTSVGVSRDGDALSITGSPITTAGTINIGFTGSNAQYINGEGDLVTFPSLSGYVPYTGATANLDLGTFDLTTDIINLNQLKAIGSGGLNIYSNSGTHIALMGGGGGAGTTFYGGIIGTTASFASSGGSDTFAINHSSGSGIALNITKGGNGEGLYINKTSGSGNAATIIGTLNATTLVKSGGTSSQFLKADGSVDSSTYLTTSSAAATYVPYTGATANVNLGIYQIISSGADFRAQGVNTPIGLVLSSEYNVIANPKTIYTGYGESTTLGGHEFRSVNGSGTGSITTLYLAPSGTATFYYSVTANSFIKSGGTSSQFLKADGSVDTTAYGTGSVTSIATSAPLTGGTITTSGTIGISQATTSTNGYLSSTDWNTFNGKQAALNGTGFVKASGTTISYDNTSYLPLTGGTLTGALSGTSATFSANISTTNATIFAKASGTEPLNYQFNSITLGFDETNNHGWITAGGAASRTNLFLQKGGGSVAIGTEIPSAKLSVTQVSGNYIFDLVNGTEGTFKLRTYNHGTSSPPTLAFTQGLYYETTENSSVRFYRGITTNDGYLALATAATDRLTITTNGNVGIGVVPFANTLSKSLDLVGGAGMFSASNNFYVTANAYFDSGWKYKAIGGAAFININSGNDGSIGFVNASSGSAGSAISFTEKLKITSDGIIQISTTSTIPSTNNSIYSYSTNGYLYIQGGSTGLALSGSGNRANAIYLNSTSNIIDFHTNDTGLKMRISSGGELSVNNTSTTARFNLYESAAKWAQIINHGRAGVQFLIQFQYNGSEVGAITSNNSNTTYATSSDYRLKEDLKDFNGLDLVSKLNVYDFAWKVDSSKRMYGVIAHEMAEVLPYAVNKQKDLMKKDGKIDPQGVDYSLITPLLVKAIQELEARIKQLENK
jgi:hypothetical protein